MANKNKTEASRGKHAAPSDESSELGQASEQSNQASEETTEEESIQGDAESLDASVTAVMSPVPDESQVPTIGVTDIPSISDDADTSSMETAVLPPISDDYQEDSSLDDYQEDSSSDDYQESPYIGFESSLDSISKNQSQRRGKIMKRFGIFFGSLIAVLLVIYGAGCLFFMDRFMPNTTIGSYDISLKTPEEAEPILDKGLANYQVKVSGQGIAFTLSADEAEVSLDSLTILKKAASDVEFWKWPVEMLKNHDLSDNLIASYGNTEINDYIRAKVEEFNATAIESLDATIAYDASSHVFKVEPEIMGTALNPDAVVRVVDEAISSLNPQVILTENELKYPLIISTNPALQQAVKTANLMIKSNLTLTVDGSEVTTLTPDTIALWITLDENIQAVINEDALNAWIDEISGGLNTVGAERSYTRPDGKAITVSGGSYGWEVDIDAFRTQLKEAVSTGQVATLAIPVLKSGNGYSGLGGKDWGNRYCDIDLSEQHARFYDDAGVLVWESDIITGRPDGKHDTPSGVYSLNHKESPSKLIGEKDPATGKPEYETYVTYWMPFVGNAIGLHDATWQPGFGGSMYADGYGSHGCVNLPYSAAEELWGIIQEGDTVVCHW